MVRAPPAAVRLPSQRAAPDAATEAMAAKIESLERQLHDAKSKTQLTKQRTTSGAAQTLSRARECKTLNLKESLLLGEEGGARDFRVRQEEEAEDCQRGALQWFLDQVSRLRKKII